jgi:hypothetical protein
MNSRYSNGSRRKKFLQLTFERLMAILVLINFLLVLFDLSYIPMRDFWLQGKVQLRIKVGPFEKEIPAEPFHILPFPITPFYDWVKDVEPYRSTTVYLQLAEELQQALNQQTLSSPNHVTAITQEKEIDRLFAELRQASANMIAQNPFQIADKTGTLERIKNRMREQIYGKPEGSATQAFETFWSRGYFSRVGTLQALDFFNSQIKPLIETNYYRPVGENGQPVDNFALIDFPFFLIFLCEFLIRTRLIKRRHAGLSWFDAMLWRWYDVFLLIPVFRWLRIIPLVVRLHQARLINLRAIKRQASQGFVATIASDISEVLVLRIVNQLQTSVRQGAVHHFLSRNQQNPYIDLNDTNEIAEVMRLLADTAINKVLPQIQPELESFLHYNIDAAIAQAPTTATLERLPGFTSVRTQLSQRLAEQISTILIATLQQMLIDDPQFDKLLKQLGNRFQSSLTEELAKRNSTDRIEALIVDLLEEVKVNYLRSLSPEDIEKIMEQSRLLKSGKS